MNETDDAILELLYEIEVDGARLALAPTAIWLNLQELEALDRAPNTISRRVKKLETMCLVDCIDEQRGYYRISDKGVAYLKGDLGYDDISHPDENS